MDNSQQLQQPPVAAAAAALPKNNSHQGLTQQTLAQAAAAASYTASCHHQQANAAAMAAAASVGTTPEVMMSMMGLGQQGTSRTFNNTLYQPTTTPAMMMQDPRGARQPGPQQHPQRPDFLHRGPNNQVWPLTKYFSVSFLGKLIDLPGGQINDHSSGEALFSYVPPSNSLVSVSDPLRAFWS